MEPNEQGQALDRTGVPTYIAEAVVALLIVLMGAVVIQGSWKLGAGWTTDGPGAGYFPFYIGVILCISGLGTLVQA
ncbi:MAG TPA: tripartite tricarboxylate transporter TctB family protein, partial [Burkholderiaceae bacterium]